jgi:hypothetical protein
MPTAQQGERARRRAQAEHEENSGWEGRSCRPPIRNGNANRACGSPKRRRESLLRLLGDEIKIYADESTITGSNLGMLNAMIVNKKGAVGALPSFIDK